MASNFRTHSSCFSGIRVAAASAVVMELAGPHSACIAGRLCSSRPAKNGIYGVRMSHFLRAGYQISMEELI